MCAECSLKGWSLSEGEAPPARAQRAVPELRKAARASGTFIADLHLTAAPSKCWSFASTGKMRRRVRQFRFVGGVIQKPSLNGRILGAHVPFRRKAQTGCHHAQADAAVARARKVKWPPLFSEGRAEVVATAVIPMGIHGALSSSVPEAKLAALRAACTSAIWGRGRARRAPELVSVLLSKGHRADP